MEKAGATAVGEVTSLGLVWLVFLGVLAVAVVVAIIWATPAIIRMFKGVSGLARRVDHSGKTKKKKGPTRPRHQ